MHFDLEALIKTIGLLGVFGIVFAESGLLVGFFLPGDSLLFTAGFLASQGFFDIRILVIGAFFSAVVGDSVGYTFGQRVGKKLFQKPNSILFNKENLEKTQEFYQKHGKKTIILARFIPVVRTFAPIIAGVGEMEYRTFFAFNLIGGLLWAVGITCLGYVLGNTIEDIDKYLLPIILSIIVISILPNVYHIMKSPSQRKYIFSLLLALKNKVLKS